MQKILQDRYTYDPADITYPLAYKEGALKRRIKKDRAGYPAAGCHGVAAKVTVNDKQYGLHRIVWMFFNGDIPKNMTIDHINGNNTDNRIENLQLLSAADNKRAGSRRLYKNNPSGKTGVIKCSATGKWKVSFKFDGVLYYFGIYSDKHEAFSVCDEHRSRLCKMSRR